MIKSPEECTIILYYHIMIRDKMSFVLIKPDFSKCENKDADHPRGNREAYQHICIRYTDSTTPLLPKTKISSF